MFVDGETDDEVFLDLIRELPAEVRGEAFMLALAVMGVDDE